MASDLYRVTPRYRFTLARIAAYDRTGADGGFIAYLDVFAENRARADGYVLADLGGGGNYGGGMNGAVAAGGAEQLRGSGKG
jgi:hypothetical protein